MKRWSHLFVGREGELELLKTAYAEAVSGKPRVVAFVAESGYGKTRIVQEFYNWLSTHHDQVEDRGYWPDRLLRVENNLIINPAPVDCGKNDGTMPFLWWGLRLSDPGDDTQVITGAMWSGVELLKSHLARQSQALRKIALDKQSRGSLAGGAKDIAFDLGLTAADFFLNASSLGLLGLGKTALEKGKDLYDYRKQQIDLDNEITAPGPVFEKAEDELINMILADLSRLAKKPPKGFESIPLIIFIDDAQWLAQDNGTGSFARSLVDRARLEDWPLLLILTSWEREWQISASQQVDPGHLAQRDLGDYVKFIEGAAGLSTLVRAAFPGLKVEEVDQILTQTDSNPRFLDEVLLFLDRNPKYFKGRDPLGSLTTKGVTAIAETDFIHLVSDRLNKAPLKVRRALGLASLHGVAFSPRLAHLTAKELDIAKIDEGLTESEVPHGFTQLHDQRINGEFRQRTYRQAALEDLGNMLNEEEAEIAFKKAQSVIGKDLKSASNRDLEVIVHFGNGNPDLGIRATCELLERVENTRDPRNAGELAARALKWIEDDKNTPDGNSVEKILRPYFVWHGANRDFINLAKKHYSRLCGLVDERNSNYDALGVRELSVLVGDIEALVSGYPTAKPYYEEYESVCRELARKLRTFSSRRDHLNALFKLGEVAYSLEGAKAARVFFEECEQLAQALDNELGTEETQEYLASASSWLGGAILSLEGPKSARPYYEKTEQYSRASNKKMNTFASKMNLASSVGGLGTIIKMLEGPGAAFKYYEEELSIWKTLDEEYNSPQTRQYLSNTLSRIGEITEELEGPEAARSIYEEDLRLLRSLNEEFSTPRMRGDLAASLMKIGDLYQRLDGSSIARPFYEESEILYRKNIEEFYIPETRSGLAGIISRLGDLALDFEGPAIAKDFYEESESIFRVLNEELNTPDTMRDLAFSLINLGDLAVDFEGGNTSRPYYEEAADILQAVNDEFETPETKRNLASAISRLGDVEHALVGPSTAKVFYEDAERHYRALNDAFGTHETGSNLALVVARLGMVMLALEGPLASKLYFEEGERISRILNEQLGTTETRGFLAIAVSKLGDVALALEGPGVARFFYQDAEQLLRCLDEEFSTYATRLDLTGAVTRLAEVTQALDGAILAEPLFKKSEQLSRCLNDEFGTHETRQNLANCLSWLGRVTLAIEGPIVAWRYYEEAEQLSREIAEEVRTPEAIQNLASATVNLGELTLELKGSSAARPYYEEAEQSYRGQHSELKSPVSGINLASTLCALGWLILTEDKTFDEAFFNLAPSDVAAENARLLLDESATLTQWAIQQDDQPNHRHWMHTILIRQGRVALATSTPSKARNYFEEAQNNLLELQEFLGLQTYSATFGRLKLFFGMLEEKSDCQSKALENYNEASDLCCSAADETHESADQYWSAAVCWRQADTAKQLGKTAIAQKSLQRGLPYAEAYADREIEDGAAILRLYQKLMTNET